MADKKISEFALVTALAAIDIIPVVQATTNKKSTLGQLKSFMAIPTSATVVSGIIPDNTTMVKVAGNCTLPPGTYDGNELAIVGTAPGKIISFGLLPQDGFTFVAGSTLKIIWCNGIWNLISVLGMTQGII